MPPATKQGRNNIGDKKRWVRQRLSSAVLTSFRCQSKSMEDSVMFKIAVRSFSSPAMKQKPERRCQYSTDPHSLEEASRFQLHFINRQHAWNFFDLDQVSTLNTGSLSLDTDLSQVEMTYPITRKKTGRSRLHVCNSAMACRCGAGVCRCRRTGVCEGAKVSLMQQADT